MNTLNFVTAAIVGYALFVIGYAVLSPHGLAGPVTAKLCKMAKCEISYGDVRRSVRATSM